VSAKRIRTNSRLSGSAANASRGASPASSAGGEGRRVPPLQLAYRYLARRAYGERELEARLRRRGVPDAELSPLLDDLKRQGYLNDAETAAQWTHSWRTVKGWGPLRVRAELARRGLDRQLIDRLLAELFSDEETETAAMRVAVKLAGRPAVARASSGGQGPVRRLAARLVCRGFPADLARRVAARCCSSRDNDMIGSEE
jgi:regulatory protein